MTALPYPYVAVVSRGGKASAQNVPLDSLNLRVVQHGWIKSLNRLDLRLVEHIASENIHEHCPPNDNCEILCAACNQVERSTGEWCPFYIIDHRLVIYSVGARLLDASEHRRLHGLRGSIEVDLFVGGMLFRNNDELQ